MTQSSQWPQGKTVSNDAALIASLHSFLDGYAAQRHRTIKASSAPGLVAFLDKARPHLRRGKILGQRADVPPSPAPTRLAATLAALREPLQQARVQGDLLQVWAIAGLKRNEVRNAAVLSWLLDPRGSHGYGSTILQRLLARAAVAAQDWPILGDDLTTVRVCTEEHPLANERDRVDIAIDGRDFCLFVEVKIDASEGQAQLSRYTEAVRDKADALRKPHALIIYLSPRPPLDPPPNIAVLTWRHISRILYEAPASGVSGALVRQYAQHVRAFY